MFFVDRCPELTCGFAQDAALNIRTDAANGPLLRAGAPTAPPPTSVQHAVMGAFPRWCWCFWSQAGELAAGCALPRRRARQLGDTNSSPKPDQRLCGSRPSRPRTMGRSSCPSPLQPGRNLRPPRARTADEQPKCRRVAAWRPLGGPSSPPAWQTRKQPEKQRGERPGRAAVPAWLAPRPALRRGLEREAPPRKLGCPAWTFDRSWKLTPRLQGPKQRPVADRLARGPRPYWAQGHPRRTPGLVPGQPTGGAARRRFAPAGCGHWPIGFRRPMPPSSNVRLASRAW